MNDETPVEQRLRRIALGARTVIIEQADAIDLGREALALLQRLPLHAEQMLSGTHFERDRQALLAKARTEQP